MYAYKQSKLLSGYPKKVIDRIYGRHPDAAAIRNNKIYLFKVCEFLNGIKISFEINFIRLKQ